MIIRWITGVIFAGVAGTALWLGHLAWGIFLLGFLVLAALEWKRLGALQDPALPCTLIIATLIFVFSFTYQSYFLSFLPLLLVFPAISVLGRQQSRRAQALVWSAGGILWLSLPTALLYFTREEFGWEVVALLLVATIGQDTFALYGGMLFGSSRPFAPGISPNKTWAGGISAVLAAVVITVVGGIYLGWPVRMCIALGLLMGVFGQLGDLSISALKRRRCLEDTGHLFPGHGGILDRVDGLIVNVSIFYPFCFWMTVVS